MNVGLTIPDEVLAQIKAEVLEQVRAELPGEDGWLNVASAARYLDCPESRVYALKSQGALPFEKDGSRVLFRRSALDKFVRDGGAKRHGGKG